MNMNNPNSLTSFAINNFRVFSEHTNFDFAPITILTGTNSSGKSSLTKALALLAKSYQISGLRKLNFFESDLKIGGYSSITNNKIDADLVTFAFKLAPSNLQFKLFYKSEKLGAFEIYKEENLIFSQLLDKTLNIDVKPFIKLPVEIINKEKLYALFVTCSDEEFEIVCQKILDYLQTGVFSSQQGLFFVNEDIFTETLSERIEGFKEFKQTYYQNDEGNTTEKCSNPSLLQIIPEEVISFGLEGIGLVDYLNLSVLDNLDLFEENILSKFFNQFVFIPGVRAKQEVVITSTNSPLLFTLLQKYNDNKDIKAHTYYSLNKWLIKEFNIMDIPSEEVVFSSLFKILPVEDLGYILQIYVDGKWQHLSNLGYGVTQLLPIILSVLFNDEPKTYIIEEPESNLHPALQSKLADFFFEAMSLKKLFPNSSKYILDVKLIGKVSLNRFIIETHSEYLIRKLQYLTASSKSKMTPDDTVIYYFYNPKVVPKNEPQIYKINITSEGALSKNFGQGFLDETSNLSLLLYQSLLNKN
jgi:predicted ATPase